MDAIKLYYEASNILQATIYAPTSRIGRITIRALYARLKEGFSRDELLWSCRAAVMSRRYKQVPGTGDFTGLWSLRWVLARGFDGLMSMATHLMHDAGLKTTEEVRCPEYVAWRKTAPPDPHLYTAPSGFVPTKHGRAALTGYVPSKPGTPEARAKARAWLAEHGLLEQWEAKLAAKKGAPA